MAGVNPEDAAYSPYSRFREQLLLSLLNLSHKAEHFAAKYRRQAGSKKHGMRLNLTGLIRISQSNDIGGRRMFRSFCVGALVGFVFGSSKKGQEVRETVDGMLTELTSSDAMKNLEDKKNKLSERACDAVLKITSKFADDNDGADSAEEESFEPLSAEKDQSKGKAKMQSDDNSKAKSESNEAESDDDAKMESDDKASMKSDEKAGGKSLDADKAQELADKLGAKPSTPEDENIAAFHHEDELKSA
jgi:hypothetical protein